MSAVSLRNTSQVFNAITQPTPNLINQIQTEWQSIKDNSSDDDSNRFEMLLLTACSRLAAYSECVEHGFSSQGGGSGGKSVS